MAKKMKCAECEATIPRNVEMYSFGGRWLCSDCFVSDVAELNAYILADLMGVDVAKAGELVEEEIPFQLSGGLYERN
jgi:hypothetical protein